MWGQSSVEINTTNFTKPNSGSGYAAYDGTRTISGVDITSSNVMVQNGNLQFKKSSGYLYNSTAMPGNITKITLATATNFTIYVGATANTETQTVTSGSTITGNYTYFKVKCGSSTGTTATITIEYSTGGGSTSSIIASNVNLVYDATSGEIEYTLNNPVENGTLSVSENVDWISNVVLNETESKVNFTTTANEETTAREGVITITYTYGDNETVTKDVTVTQAAAPVIYDNIEDLFNAATSTATEVNVEFGSWFVTGVSTNGKNVFVTDGTNGFVIFDNGGGLGDTYHVDDLIEGTTTASLVLYTGFAELKNVDATNLTMTSYGAPAFSDVAMADLSGINTGALVHYENLTCSVDNNKYYLSDGTTTLQVYNTLYAFGTALEANHIYNITGVYQQYNNTKEILPRSVTDIEEVISADPSVTVADATVSVDAEGAEGTLTVTYENITEVVAEVYFCNAEGETATYEWITADINTDNNVEYLVEPNEGEARTAYFKVYALDDEGEDVYSNLVTVNQAEYVAPTFAELPFEFDDGKSAIENTDGLYQEGLGNDYNGGNNATTPLKFDGTGDWLLLQFNERPGTLTFDITGNSFSGSTFTVQTSEDGVTYTDLETYTELGDTQNEEFTNLGENVRYIKWIYTNKSSGNVGLGNIALAEYVAPVLVSSITLNPDEVNVDAEEHDGTLDLTYENMPITDMSDFDIQYYDAEGEETSEPDWIEVLVAEQDPEIGEGYVVSYYMFENEDNEAHVAYFKVYAMDEETNIVYSNLVTVTQAAPVVPPTPGNWMLTNLSDLTEDDVFVIVGDNGDTYALSNDNGTQSAPTAVAVTVVEGTLSEEPAINLQWNLEITDDGYVFYPNGTTESWLYCINSNNGVRVGTNTNNVFVLDDESNYLKNVATSRYIGVYNSQDWRCYTNTTGNIADQTFAFYKKVEPVEPVVYFFEGTGDCETVSLQGSSVTLPLATISCSDWAFAGWATSPVNETTSAPTLYTGTYAPTGDMFLYAIYQNNGTYNSFPACVYTQLDVTEGFESYTESHIPRTFVKPTGWTVVTQNEPLTRSKMGRPQVGYGAWYAHEGDYCLFMDSLCVLAMPKLDNGISFSGLEMEFYLKQAFDYQYLEVGVMSDLADPESFELIETISNVGSAVNKRVVDFSGYQGTGRYIAFRNAYSGGDGLKNSYNYLDDIVVRLNNLTCGITELPYTQNFDNLTDITELRTGIQPECWTEAQRYANYAAAYEPQLVYGASYAHSGTYTLQLDGLCIYAMPELKVPDKSVEDMQLEFYVRQYSANCSLEVGVMSNLNDANSFVALETVSNNGVSGSQKHVVDFGQYAEDIPSGAKYIAFRNIYNGVWNRSPQNIDDINLTERAEDNCGITELPYTQNFDNLTDITELRTGIQPECWSEAHRYANYAAAYEPQLVYGASYAHSGTYTLQLDGLCIYAMPELKVPDKSVEDMQLEFYVRQYSANCSLEVGVMSNLNDANSFVALETVSNNGVTGSQKHVVDFGQYSDDIPSGAKYIAFRNIYNSAWNRSPQNIDDINLTERVEDNCGITELPYTQNFDSLTDITDLRTGIQPECWTEAHRYANYAAAYEPQLIYGAAYAHSGTYTLQLDGLCIYAMPELKVPDKSVEDMQLEFYVRQYSANCSLEVGVMSNLNDANSFVALDTVSNNGVSGSQKHVVDFSQYAENIPSGAKYIAFRNIYNGAWNRSPQNLDDITLSVPEAKIAEVSSENVIDVNDVERYLEDIRVYPNPTTGNLYINAMDVQKVECYNQMGQLVGVYDNANELNISDLSNGVYMLRITVPQGVTMRKVVKK